MEQQQTSRLITLLNDCARVCNQCAVACLNEKDPGMLAACIKTDLDCATLCHTTATFLERGSGDADAVLSVCGVVCDHCADECEKHSHMEHCRICAEICRQCAEACQQMEHI